MQVNTVFGPVELTKGTPKQSLGLDLEGFYIIFKANGGNMYQDYISVAYIRLDPDKQDYVLDVVGQEKRYSEDLWRYNQDWWFSKKIL